jgi:hypothetical protein
MRSLLLASVALMAGPAAPPSATPVPERPSKPCPEVNKEPQPVRPDKPSDAQRFNPGLF